MKYFNNFIEMGNANVNYKNKKSEAEDEGKWAHTFQRFVIGANREKVTCFLSFFAS